MTAVIYARYSSDNQREESIEGQIRECTAYPRTAAHAVLPDAGRDRSAGTLGGRYRKAETYDGCGFCRG